jgi:hypothetical protein
VKIEMKKAGENHLHKKNLEYVRQSLYLLSTYVLLPIYFIIYYLNNMYLGTITYHLSTVVCMLNA